jgi:hypothetical protein
MKPAAPVTRALIAPILSGTQLQERVGDKEEFVAPEMALGQCLRQHEV